jgi:hypothetical protein
MLHQFNICFDRKTSPIRGRVHSLFGENGQGLGDPNFTILQSQISQGNKRNAMS